MVVDTLMWLCSIQESDPISWTDLWVMSDTYGRKKCREEIMVAQSALKWDSTPDRTEASAIGNPTSDNGCARVRSNVYLLYAPLKEIQWRATIHLQVLGAARQPVHSGRFL